MKTINKIFLILLIIINSVIVVSAVNKDEFDYVNMYLDENGTKNLVHYTLNAQNDLYYFKCNIYHNNQTISDCDKTLSFDKNDLKFQKISCEFENNGEGEYTFESFLYDENNSLIKKIVNKEYFFEDSNTQMSFKIEENKTTIIIKVEGNKSVIVSNYIPKSVIETLTEENKNSLINSNFPYEILDEDPLIAWNIEEPPATINYTINKQITPEEQREFQLEIQNSPTFKWLKYTIFVIILLILGLLIKPIFKKK